LTTFVDYGNIVLIYIKNILIECVLGMYKTNFRRIVYDGEEENFHRFVGKFANAYALFGCL